MGQVADDRQLGDTRDLKRTGKKRASSTADRFPAPSCSMVDENRIVSSDALGCALDPAKPTPVRHVVLVHGGTPADQ
jgi:hypothetical protein